MFGRLAAQLERDVLERVGGASHDVLAGRGVARERDLVDAGMLHERLSRGASASGDDVEHAGRQSDLRGDFADQQRGQRRLTRRFQDDRIARRQRRRHFPHREQQREVPRDDGGDDAERLATRVDERRALYGDGVAVDLVRPPGEVLQALDGHRHFDVPRLGDRLAVVQRLQPRELVDPLRASVRPASRSAGRAHAPASGPTGR